MPLTPVMRPPTTAMSHARREQIIVAAVEIITTRGLHNLSLSKIETPAA